MLPGVQLNPFHVEMDEIRQLGGPEEWRARFGLAPEQVNAWLVLADPFSIHPDMLVSGLAAAYPGKTIAGGLASGEGQVQGTFLFVNDTVYTSGAIVLAIGGAYTLLSVVAQGAAPIGEPWTITEADGNVLRTIGNRPPLDVLRDTLNALSDPMRSRAARNLLVGLAMDEYREQFDQGDFLIRNLMGVDPDSGAMAIGAEPELGQTIQFQVRDA